MASLLLPREETPDQGNGQQDADKTGDDADGDIGEGKAPAAVADELERLPLEGGERGVTATEAGADQKKPVIVLRRQALQDDDRRGSQDERAADIDEHRPKRKGLTP